LARWTTAGITGDAFERADFAMKTATVAQQTGVHLAVGPELERVEDIERLWSGATGEGSRCAIGF
jgi:hypothetical protein